MTKHHGLIKFAASAIFILIATDLSAQQQLLRKEAIGISPGARENQRKEASAAYRTPSLFGGDSLEEEYGTLQFIDSLTKEVDDSIGADTLEGRQALSKPEEKGQIIPKPGPAELKYFGENLFSSAKADFSPPPIAAVPPDYRLGPGDNLVVNLWGSVDLELNLTVDREGKVFVPQAGDIPAFGMTLEEFRERLEKRLSTIYSNFGMNVMLGKIRTIRVYVYGEVKNPGGYTLSSLSTIMNALYFSGGPTANGSLRDIRLVRSGRTIASIDFYRFLLQGELADNQLLESEDVIFVPVVGPRVAVRGEVKRPAIYELKGNESLLDVIALAGGVDDNAYLGRVMIDRIKDGDDRQLLDLSLASADDKAINNIPINAGDDISVFGIYEMRQNIVWLTGHVKHPGAYQLEEHETISGLLDGGQQLREEAYLSRADLIRTSPDSRQTLIPIDIARAIQGDPQHDLWLEANDSLRIYGNWEIVREKFVSIGGEVRNPGQYKLFENMRVSDLIFMAGDLNRSAYTLGAEIARRSPGKEIEIIYVDLEAIYSRHESEADLLLQEDDYLFIRKMPQWDLDRFVTITGEVKFPGKYALFRQDETLYGLIQRAGGLTDKAFAFGTIFIRGEIGRKLELMSLEQILDRSNPIIFDSLGNPTRSSLMSYNPEELSRMVIDVDLIMRSGGQKGNVVLQKGDKIYIPPLPSGVQVTGAVASSGTIKYEPGKRVKYYVNLAGGYLPHADKDQLRVIMANGQVVSGSKARQFRIGLGDVVMVPSKIKK